MEDHPSHQNNQAQKRESFDHKLFFLENSPLVAL